MRIYYKQLEDYINLYRKHKDKPITNIALTLAKEATEIHLLNEKVPIDNEDGSCLDDDINLSKKGRDTEIYLQFKVNNKIKALIWSIGTSDNSFYSSWESYYSKHGKGLKYEYNWDDRTVYELINFYLFKDKKANKTNNLPIVEKSINKLANLDLND